VVFHSKQDVQNVKSFKPPLLHPRGEPAVPFKYETGWILDPAWTLGRRKKIERKLTFKVLGTFLLCVCSCICITNLFLDWWFGEVPSHADLYCAV